MRKNRLQRGLSEVKAQEKNFSVPRPPIVNQQETPRKPGHNARSVPSRKNKNLIIQVIDDRPRSHSVCGTTVVATTTKVDEWVQIDSRKQHNVTK